MNRMDGKICVVTGSTQGLGAAIARRFAEAGADGIVTLGRGTGKGQAVAEAITRDTGVPVHFTRADVGRVEDCRAVFAELDRRFGKVHVLVNAAGMTDRGTILDTSPELFDALFAVNVRGPYFLMQMPVPCAPRRRLPGHCDCTSRRRPRDSPSRAASENPVVSAGPRAA